MEEQSRVGWRVLAAAGAAVALALGGLGAFAQHRHHQVDVAAEDATRTARTGAEIAAAVTGVLLDHRAAATAIAGGAAPADRTLPGALAVAVVRLDGANASVVEGGLPPGTVDDDAFTIAAGTARDSGAPIVSAPTANGHTVLVVPVYAGPGDPTTELPAGSTAARRAASAGVVAAVLDLGGLLDGIAGAVVRDGRTVLADSRGPADRRVPLGEPQVVQVAHRRWQVALPASPVALRNGPIVTAAAGVGLAALFVVGSGAAGRAVRRARVEMAARVRQAETVRRVTPILEAGQDLGEVLPGLAVLLEEDLGINGFAVMAIEGGAEERDVFAIGRPVDRDVPARDTVPGHLAPGDTVAVALQRGNRDVAVLRARAGRPLDRPELEVVVAVAQLLTAAFLNAQAAERSEHAVRSLRDLNELKNMFLGVASHELRTPVTAISGFARLLVDRWDDMAEDQRRLLAVRIEANGAALGVLVQALLDFSRLERGRLVVGEEEVDLAGRLETVVERLGPVWDGRALRVRAHERPVVVGDGDAIERVLVNLLSNASKFSPPDSPVEGIVTVEGEMAVLMIDDAGPGVPQDERTRIYGAFVRGSGEDVARTRGAGIGLSVVKEIVDQLGGTIDVGDSPLGGARFTVRLPLAPAASASEGAG